MLKRRPSKRFVLAETGEETAWNTTTDNDLTTASGSTTPQIQIDMGFVEATPPPTMVIEESPPVTEKLEIATTTTKQQLTVPQTTKSGMK